MPPLNPPDDGIIAAKSDATFRIAAEDEPHTPIRALLDPQNGERGSRSNDIVLTVRLRRIPGHYVAGVYKRDRQNASIFYVNGVLNDSITVGNASGLPSESAECQNPHWATDGGNSRFQWRHRLVSAFTTVTPTKSEIQADMNTPPWAAGTDTQPPTAPRILNRQQRETRARSTAVGVASTTYRADWLSDRSVAKVPDACKSRANCYDLYDELQ